MRSNHSSRSTFLVVLIALLFSPLAAPSRADTLVLPGFDLLETLPGTALSGVPFMGVPLGTFNFGGSIGVKPVGNTDTIVHRLNPAIAPSTAIPTELVALHLESTIPTNFGLGTGFYFVTLQSERGGPASTGRMTINFGPEAPPGSPHGTFDSFFDVFFDVRLGSLNGPIALSNELTITQAGAPWNHFPLPGEFLIDGVNHRLNGSTEENDFQPLGIITEQHPNATHVVRVTGSGSQVPEPGSLATLAAAAFGLAGFAIKRRTQPN